MPSGARGLRDLARGEALPPFALSVSADDVCGYLGATGEPPERWTDAAPPAVPPLALGAFAIAALMERMALPAGALHTGQEFAFLRAVAPGEPLEARVEVVQHAERRGALIAALAVELRDGAGEPVLRGRSTVAAPARGAGDGGAAP